MPFNPTASVISTDLDNMLRGLYRDNSDRVITGTTSDSPMAGVNISPNTIGPTGGIRVHAAGSCVGAGGGRTIGVFFGSGGSRVNVCSLTVPAGTQCWEIECWIFNTATNAQRAVARMAYWPAAVGSPGTAVVQEQHTNMAVDTSQNQVIQTAVTPLSALDTVTNRMFTVMVVQIN